MKVLILDDEPDIRFLAALGLERFGGMSVCEAASADEAIRLVRSEAPDLILLDVVMPLEDGPTVLGRLKADPATTALPVIFMTANATPTDVDRFVRLGACAVISKPFDPITLGDEIRSVLSASEDRSDL